MFSPDTTVIHQRIFQAFRLPLSREGEREVGGKGKRERGWEGDMTVCSRNNSKVVYVTVLRSKVTDFWVGNLWSSSQQTHLSERRMLAEANSWCSGWLLSSHTFKNLLRSTPGCLRLPTADTLRSRAQPFWLLHPSSYYLSQAHSLPSTLKNSSTN